MGERDSARASLRAGLTVVSIDDAAFDCCGSPEAAGPVCQRKSKPYFRQGRVVGVDTGVHSGGGSS